LSNEQPNKPAKYTDKTPKPTNESGMSIRKLDLSSLQNDLNPNS